MLLLHKPFPSLRDSPLVSSQIIRKCFCLKYFIERCLYRREFFFGRAIGACLLLLSTQNVLAVTVGDAAPACALTVIDGGQKINLNQFKGKVVYVDFWASWCGPCAKSFPFLSELHHQLKDQDLQIVGINLDENRDDAKAFLSSYPASFTITEDTDSQCAQAFSVKAMPSSYLIDRNGTVRHVHLGFRSGEASELQELIEKLLKK
jgi:thiol-disulfide isomerase/thioredoxin